MEKPTLIDFKKIYPLHLNSYKKYIPEAFDNALTILEKLHLILKRLNEIGELSSEVIEKWNEVMKWIMNDGLTIEVAKKLQEWLNDGTLENIINEVIFNDLTTKINRLLAIQDNDYIDVLQPPNGMPPAINDGLTPTSDRINDILNTYKGKKIYFPEGEYLIDKSLIPDTNHTIKLSHHAVLKFIPNQVRNSSNVNNWNGNHIVKPVIGAKNIEIYGGVIWGQGKTQERDLHKGFYLESNKHIKIHDITIKEVSGWGICHVKCDDYHFYNIYLDQCPESEYGYNGDGITGMSTGSGIIENISGYTSDDMVALYAGSVYFPTGDINNVIIRNIFPQRKKWIDVYGNNREDVTHRAVALYASMSRKISNILIDGVTGESALGITLVNRRLSEGYGYGYAENITFKNINLIYDKYIPDEFDGAIEIKDMHCKNITISDSNLRFSGEFGNIRRFLNINGGSIDILKILNSNINVANTDVTQISDKSNISSLIMSNLSLMFGGSLRGNFYYKQDGASGLTLIKANNIVTNASREVHVQNSSLKIRLNTWDLQIAETTVQLDNQQQGDLIKTEKGQGAIYNGYIRYFNDVQPEKRIPLTSAIGNSYDVILTGKEVMRNNTYGVVLGAEWACGSIWVDPTTKTTTGFTVRWDNKPTTDCGFTYKLTTNETSTAV